ncbi:hypothetical protein Poli38472_000052 [Pythium oligandrum]|uniref:Uncharacterized protein n=1 Tax=Pythium oligandrum TaxID=41045 RepID=A0A8K1CBD6_PYTOL|nr:hypothetical protein Poli38472_000052 [Pythium oligandrum]|eukprot:TMW60010.1 hypothetical protein Poli38472_000052 [Pythium oligandrum]
MTLKFCTTLWGSEDGAAQLRLDQLFQTESKPTRQAFKYAKEFQVAFKCGAVTHGLQLRCDPQCAARYYSVVTSVEWGSQTVTYNDKCRSAGNYARIIVEGLHVRSVNHKDVAGLELDDVVRLLEETHKQSKTEEYYVTFADVFSKLLPSTASGPKLKTVGKIVLMAQKTSSSPFVNKTSSNSILVQSGILKRGSIASGRSSRSSSIANGNVDAKVSKWSSLLSGESTPSQSDALAQDLMAKNDDLQAQLRQFKLQVTEQSEERARWEEEQERWSKDKQQLVSWIRSTKMFLGGMDSNSSDTKALEMDLGVISKQMTTLVDEKNELATLQVDYEDRLAQKDSTIDTLHHQKEALELTISELRHEHQDLQQHVEELHTRLVDSQRRQSVVTDQLATVASQRAKESEAFAIVESEMADFDGSVSPRQTAQRRRSSIALLDQITARGDVDERHLSVLRKLVTERNALKTEIDELRVEVACHEANLHTKSQRIAELEQNEAAAQHSIGMEQGCIEGPGATQDVAQNQIDLSKQVALITGKYEAERTARVRIEEALQVLEDKARTKLETHEKEQRYLTQFKQQLAAGIVVTKYGARGNPHPRILFSDPQCRWLSWRKPSDSATTSPRADAKAEVLDLVEVLHGARSETFHLQPPETPARCLSLVFLRPCRTLDLEVENRERATTLVHGFRLLLEEAAEKRKNEE